ncbi:hypothetical protein EV424DRAFT_963962 [Suillus variegatus]|nr:hypothetical protein EV424DRAFT_963962 [Suillus variegatus]
MCYTHNMRGHVQLSFVSLLFSTCALTSQLTNCHPLSISTVHSGMSFRSCARIDFADLYRRIFSSISRRTNVWGAKHVCMPRAHRTRSY